ncbi:hypothetical protein OG552_15335 [Streptomyces sp. NBC_01476]|uniref:hypothetical protein n=1 Tax=Streptomyces sp. NBC_01476 TaxID=2903881 RepID=UPI002E3291F7|nr:hypothetical protein [Streptomyces sp. NBC_01476]
MIDTLMVESWLVTRSGPYDSTVHEVLYNSEPGGPHALNGGSTAPLLAAINARLDQIGLPPRAPSSRLEPFNAADAVLHRAGFVSEVTHRGRFHHLPAGMTDPVEQRHTVTRTVDMLGAEGFAYAVDADLLDHSLLVRTDNGLSLGDRLDHLTQSLSRAGHTSQAVAVLSELTAPGDGVLDRLTEVLDATADWWEGLGETADPLYATSLRRINRQMGVSTQEIYNLRNTLADRHAEHPLRARSGPITSQEPRVAAALAFSPPGERIPRRRPRPRPPLHRRLSGPRPPPAADRRTSRMPALTGTSRTLSLLPPAPAPCSERIAMPAHATRYDAQLIERFGSIDAFRARRHSPDPAEWGPALDYVRLAETETELVQLRSRVWMLTAPGSYPDTGLAAKLDVVIDDMYVLIALREDTALTLEMQLGLTAPPTEHGKMFDPHWHLTPAPGTIRTTEKAPPPIDDDAESGTHTPPARTVLTAFDARVEALAGDLDQLRALADQPQADPALRELNSSHLGLIDAETVCLFHRVRINTLADGRWYVDGPLVSTIDEALTALEAGITTRDDHARDLEQRLDWLEADATRDPARAAGLMFAASATAVPVESGDRHAAAQAVSPAAQRHGTPTVTPAETPAPPNAAPASVHHR